MVANGHILDAGCGSGRDSKAFQELGYAVSAFDASEEICRFATEYLGQEVQCRRFEDVIEENCYDGIWASASLLHVSKKDIDEFQEYKFSEHCFVYGKNTRGKTALTIVIDYILGSSDKLTYQGLDNIDSIEALLKNEMTSLWIKRTVKEGGYFYRRRKRYSIIN